jgi:hypothetical protein
LAKINKISVDGVTYDIEDKSVPSWAKSSAKPTYKTSELENDSNFITETKVDEKIASVAAGGGSSSNIYSTEEQIVGTWLGVPLYRKTLITTTHSQANTDTEIGSLPEAKEVIKVSGYWRSWLEGEGHNLYINTYYNSNDHVDVFFYEVTRKLFAIGGSNYLNKTLFLTVEYIKEAPTINE